LAEDPNSYWSGYYSTRAATKKFAKDASAQYHSISNFLAHRVLNQKATKSEVAEAVKANEIMVENLSLIQHHDGITGTDVQNTDRDYRIKISKAMNLGSILYNQDLS